MENDRLTLFGFPGSLLPGSSRKGRNPDPGSPGRSPLIRAFGPNAVSGMVRVLLVLVCLGAVSCAPYLNKESKTKEQAKEVHEEEIEPSPDQPLSEANGTSVAMKEEAIPASKAPKPAETPSSGRTVGAEEKREQKAEPVVPAPEAAGTPIPPKAEEPQQPPAVTEAVSPPPEATGQEIPAAVPPPEKEVKSVETPGPEAGAEKPPDQIGEILPSPESTPEAGAELKQVPEERVGKRFAGEEKPGGTNRYTVTLRDVEGEAQIRRSREKPQLISLNFKETKLDAVIRLLGEVSGFNFVIHPSVGKIEATNMLLTDVTWEQALDIVLKTHNLTMQRMDGVILITTFENLIEQQKMSSQEAEERKRQAEAKRLELEEQLKSQKINEEEKLTFKTFKLKFAEAKVVRIHLLELYGGAAPAAGAQPAAGAGATGVGGAGTAPTTGTTTTPGTAQAGGIRISSYDPDNSITVFATESRIREVEKRINELDTPAPQIYIQARIVEIGKNYSKGLGIQWGGLYTATTGKDFPNAVGVGGAAGTSQVGTNNESAVNFPAFNATVDQEGNVRPPEESAGIGLNLAHVAGTAALNARLSALEKDGKSKTISNPKIITINGKEAVISSGRKIPVQTIDADGKITTVFVDATLELKVTAVITQDKSMLLTIAAKRDEADFTRVVQGNPTIVKKAVNTTIRVSNGGTAVLGGIYEERTSTTDTGVPTLRKLPVVGKAFGSNKATEDGSELLIFITPTIVDPRSVS